MEDLRTLLHSLKHSSHFELSSHFLDNFKLLGCLAHLSALRSSLFSSIIKLSCIVLDHLRSDSALSGICSGCFSLSGYKLLQEVSLSLESVGDMVGSIHVFLLKGSGLGLAERRSILLMVEGL